MKNQFIQLNDVYGEWLVISYSESRFYKNKYGHSDHTKYCLCRCSCGVIKEVAQNTLISGLSKSCGHNRKVSKRASRSIDDTTNKRSIRHAILDIENLMLNLESKVKVKKSGNLVCGVGYNDVDFPTSQRISGKLYHHPAYRSWFNMLNRCYSDRQSAYKDVIVEEYWHSFSNFLAWWKDNYKLGV